MTRTPQEVFAHHGQALAAGDLDEIVADYAEDSVVITAAGVARGKDGVRKVFAKLLGDLPDAAWDLKTQISRRRRAVSRVGRRLGGQPGRRRRRHLRLPRRHDLGADRPIHPASQGLTGRAHRQSRFCHVEQVDLTAVAEWMSQQGLGEGPLEDVSGVTGGHAERHAAVHPVRPALRAATRAAAPASAQQQRDPAGNQSPCGAGRLRRAAPAPDRHLRDPGVLGDAVFYLMEPVDGFNAGEGLPPLHAGDPAVRFGMGLSMADALARLGAVDHVAVGLADFGKPEGFLERQVPRWLSELDSYNEYDGYPGPQIPGIEQVAGWLEANRPTTWTPGIMHGDYHAANVMFSRTGPEVVAIVDWEMCTIGDPLLDLGWLLCTWRQSDGTAVFSHALGGQDGLASTDELFAAVRRQHHPRPVAHHLVHRAGLLQARHRDRRDAGPGMRGQGREGGRRPTPRGHRAPVRAGARADRISIAPLRIPNCPRALRRIPARRRPPRS